MLLSAAVLGTMVWLISATVRGIVLDYEKWIAWTSVALMLLFVVRGQWAVAKALFRHYLQGNYTIKRSACSSCASWLFDARPSITARPDSGAALFGYDPIFLQAFIGAIGVTGVILGSLIGFLFGSRARHRRTHLADGGSATL